MRTATEPLESSKLLAEQFSRLLSTLGEPFPPHAASPFVFDGLLTKRFIYSRVHFYVGAGFAGNYA